MGHVLDREPARPDRRRHGDGGERHGRAGRGPDDARRVEGDARPATRDAGRRQGLRRRRVLPDLEARAIEPHIPLVKEPRDPKVVTVPEADSGRPGSSADETADADRGVSAQSDVPQESGGRLRLAEDGRGVGSESDGGAVEAAATAGGRSRRLQPGPPADAGPGRVGSRPGPGATQSQDRGNRHDEQLETGRKPEFFSGLLAVEDCPHRLVE